MKIKVVKKSFDEVMSLPRPRHVYPKRTSLPFRALMRLSSRAGLKATGFTCERVGMEKWKGEPALVLMNHSCFLDLSIASSLLYPRPFNIVCTSDGFVGKEWFMRSLGCIPTQKFVSDLTLVKDMLHCVRTLGSSVLMYPEASYSFDGTPTPLPQSLGKCLKVLKVPVVIIMTKGAFARDPLYNGLQLRKVKVSAEMRYLLSPEEVASKSVEELNAILSSAFSFDNFRWQQEAKVEVREPFRADFLNRILYKCSSCGREGGMEGKGIHLSCKYCGKKMELTPLGLLEAIKGKAEFTHIPDWFAWQREAVRKEILEGRYSLEAEVDVHMMVNFKAVYDIGKAHLVHNADGFRLTGCGGKLDYRQSPIASYSLYSDYFWYELGDIICIGDRDALYYCFPRIGRDVVAKTRIAAEELYKLAVGKARHAAIAQA
jgi:1-acyl-sn-glycerol-3-phosphate acyltransferase